MAKIKPEILAHLSKDKKLKKIIEKQGVITVTAKEDPYTALLGSIVSQQLSVKAAATIWSRFLALFPKNDPQPKWVLKKTDDELRAVGLSYQKANYLKNIAQFALDGGFEKTRIKKLNDEELIEHFTQVKGVGKWTVQMLLMFSLNKSDVFPEDDLGIQNAMKAVYGLTSEKKQLKTEMHIIATKWSPYRTVACKYLWRHKDNTPTPKK